MTSANNAPLSVKKEFLEKIFLIKAILKKGTNEFSNVNLHLSTMTRFLGVLTYDKLLEKNTNY